MDSHEKLGNLLSEYLSSPEPEKVPQNVVDAFHLLELTEFATREHVDETYRTKCEAVETDRRNSPSSRYAADYAAQQKKELDAAYSAIIAWLDKKA